MNAYLISLQKSTRVTCNSVRRHTVPCFWFPLGIEPRGWFSYNAWHISNEEGEQAFTIGQQTIGPSLQVFSSPICPGTAIRPWRMRTKFSSFLQGKTMKSWGGSFFSDKTHSIIFLKCSFPLSASTVKILCFKNCKTHLSRITIPKHISYDATVITPAPLPGGLVHLLREKNNNAVYYESLQDLSLIRNKYYTEEQELAS